MRTWPHSGFSVDQSVFLPAGDRPGIERLVQYMTRCPFSLSRLVKVTKTGQVMKVVAFIEPPLGAVIEKILRHCGLWQPSTPRAPPAVDAWVHDPDRDSDSQTARSDAPLGITYVDIDTFEATF